MIAVNEEETNIEVTLLCKVNINNGIEKWKNVAYKIEWFAGGKSVYEEEICGNLPDGMENKFPCPDGELVSKLKGSQYEIGQWVRSYYLLSIAIYLASFRSENFF